MKLILDCDPGDMGVAINLAFRVMADNPQQKTGTGNAVVETVNGVDFQVIRNLDSYTVRGTYGS